MEALHRQPVWNKKLINQVGSDLDCYPFEVDVLTSERKSSKHSFQLELQQSAANLVNEITQALSERVTPETVVFNDRCAIESALFEALSSYSQEQPLLEISFDIEGQKRNKKRYHYEHIYEPVYVWDEIELDEEIDTIEEEIARLQEQKQQLKRSASQPLLDSPSDSPICSSNEEDGQSSEDEDLAHQMNLSKSRSRKRKQSLEKKSRKRSKNFTTSQIDFKIEFSISHQSFDCESTSQQQDSNSISNTSISTSTSSTLCKSTNEEVFRDEEVLVIKPSLSSESEDEDIDILN